MKTKLLVIFGSVAIAASAAWEQIGALRVSNPATLAKATVKLGEISANQMLPGLLAGYFANPPGVKFFGPMRQGAAAMLPVYIDSKAFAKETDYDDLLEFVEVAVLYPISITKADFLKRHPGAVETNGVFRIKGGFDGDDGNTVIYVAITPDGRWAVASDKIGQVKASLVKTACAEKPLEGNLAEAYVSRKGVELLRVLAGRLVLEAKKANAPIDARFIDVLAGVDGFTTGIGISDNGIDVRGSLKTLPGTEMAKIGLNPLPADPLGFAGGDAVFAESDAAFVKPDPVKILKDAGTVLKRHGVDIFRFVSSTRVGNAALFRFDGAALAGFITGPATNVFPKIDGAKLGEELQKAVEAGDVPFKAAQKPQNSALSLAGYTPKHTVSARFAATLPEAKGKPVFTAAVFSLSAFVQAMTPVVVSAVPETERASIQPLLAFLPQECAAGLASMSWREKDTLHFIFRISSGELKGISTAVSGVMAFMMAQEMKE